MRALGDENWSIVHGFYANAGGFILRTPNFPDFPVNAMSMHYLCSKGYISFPEITRSDIWDRSKADLFAKGVALFQTCWLVISLIARGIQGLTITPIELFTVAFLVPTAATFTFWANKPQNVDEPTVIRVGWSLAGLLLDAGEMAKDPYVDTPMDFVEKPAWDGRKRRPSLLRYGGLERRPLARTPNDYPPAPPTGMEALFVWVISVIHAGIHLTGWNFPFSTYTEVLIWRISSLILLVVVAISGIFPILSSRKWFDFSFNPLWIWVVDARNPTWARRHLFKIVVDFAYVLYILARILIFLGMFVAFRSLPGDAYDEISWVAILPHL
ncbi:hypothetical protein DL771_006679 [Monosporascus sp. 5C6A]|nr:hypothetical protein DL771_006679 [Monosporascus sp. 5C6A]